MMNCTEFINETAVRLDDGLFRGLKDALVGTYVSFSVVKAEDITKKILAEKICDYFEKVELKTGKTFDKIIERYMSNLDSVVGDRIAKEARGKKKQQASPTPRARKYYEKAGTLRKSNKSMKQLLDYSRVMMCLYMEIIKNGRREIENFDFSAECLNLTRMMDALRGETGLIAQKARFDTKEPYALDRCTFIVVILMFYYIKSKEVAGEY